MSRYSQGVLARKLVNSPESDRSKGACLAAGDDPVGDALELLRAQVAAVLDDDLEAAGGPQAVDRRGLEDVDQAVLDLLLKRLLRAATASTGPVSPSWARWWKSSSITYIAPKLGALAFIRIDWPAIARVCETPGILPASRSTSAITFWVRSSDDESGSWTLTSR